MARPIYQRVAVTDAGDVIPGAEYTVTNENTGTEQTIYDARSGGSVISQPAFADANGVIQFWTEPGVTYRVEATGGVGTYTDRYVEADTRMTDLSDPASGSLMPPGAFGLGITQTELVGNLNDAIRGSLFQFGSSDSNLPVSGKSGAGVAMRGPASDRSAQIAMTVDGNAPAVSVRTELSGVFTDWQRIDPQAFGLGEGVTNADDLDTVDETSLKYQGGGSSNRPAGSNGGQLVQVESGAGNVYQIFHDEASIWFRRQVDAWTEMYHTGNLLGTVSQSGGVPTGAVIERGSNANGEYVKFADGTMIMTANVTASLTSGGVQTFPFPAAIIDGADSPYLSFGIGGNASERTQYRLTDGFLTTSLDDSWSVQLTSTGGATGTCTIRLIAIGRWF